MANEEVLDMKMSDEELDAVAGGNWAETATLTDYVMNNATNLGSRSDLPKVYGSNTRTPQMDEKFLTKYLGDCGIRCVCNVNKGNTYTVAATGKMLSHSEVYRYLQVKGYVPCRGGLHCQVHQLHRDPGRHEDRCDRFLQHLHLYRTGIQHLY